MLCLGIYWCLYANVHGKIVAYVVYPSLQDIIPYVVKNLSLALLKMGKVCPKHVELILEINKTVIVASRWFLYYLIYTHDYGG